MGLRGRSHLAGGVIAPRTPQKDIRMDSVEVRFELRSYTYWADAEFSLYNTGDTTTVQIGFPMHGEATPVESHIEWTDLG